MSANINFKKAIQVAAFSIVWEALSSSELASMANIAALALGIFAIYGVEAASQIKEGFDLSHNARRYRVARLPDFGPQKNEETFSHAVEYLKQNHKKAVKWLCKDFSALFQSRCYPMVSRSTLQGYLSWTSDASS